MLVVQPAKHDPKWGPGDQEDQAHPGLGQTKCGQMEQGTAEVTPQILCSVSGSHNQKDSEVLE